MTEITKELIRDVGERTRKFRFLVEYFSGFPSKAFPKGNFNENGVRELAKKQGTTFESLVDDLYDWTQGK
jgi:hypothetical protein